MKVEKTQEIGNGKRQERNWGCWKDKQHRRKKLRVRHLVFPEAILKQDSAGVSLYEKRGNRKKKTREIVRNREIPQLEQLRQPKLKATHSKTADVHLDFQPRHPPTQSADPFSSHPLCPATFSWSQILTYISKVLQVVAGLLKSFGHGGSIWIKTFAHCSWPTSEACQRAARP